MAYRIRDHQTISGTVSGSFRYPASENGGSETVTLEWVEGVEILVTVDDDPFQQSVADCKNDVDLLTASVVATEAAQVASKAEAAQKISGEVVKGFFGFIQSTLTQQMTKLSMSLGPKLQEILNLSARCRALQEQMEKDYNRIKGRYVRLFEDLDKEFKKRIKNLDTEAFSLRLASADPVSDSSRSTLVATQTLGSRETQIAQSQLLTYAVKHSALSIISSASRSIDAGVRLREDISAINEDIKTDEEQTLLVPAVFIEKEGLSGGKETKIYFPENAPFGKELEAKREYCLERTEQLNGFAGGTKTDIGESLKQLIIQRAGANPDARFQREAETIQQLWNNAVVKEN